MSQPSQTSEASQPFDPNRAFGAILESARAMAILAAEQWAVADSFLQERGRRPAAELVQRQGQLAAERSLGEGRMLAFLQRSHPHTERHRPALALAATLGPFEYIGREAVAIAGLASLLAEMPLGRQLADSIDTPLKQHRCRIDAQLQLLLEHFEALAKTGGAKSEPSSSFLSNADHEACVCAPVYEQGVRQLTSFVSQQMDMEAGLAGERLLRAYERIETHAQAVARVLSASFGLPTLASDSAGWQSVPAASRFGGVLGRRRSERGVAGPLNVERSPLGPGEDALAP